ncbi:MAG: hypothetical protein LBT53_04870 [Puniceicoccales bacterium]|jgi:hypothetical protein|nr:hypothetical protein [Puniceicoccales bacterium]
MAAGNYRKCHNWKIKSKAKKRLTLFTAPTSQTGLSVAHCESSVGGRGGELRAVWHRIPKWRRVTIENVIIGKLKARQKKRLALFTAWHFLPHEHGVETQYRSGSAKIREWPLKRRVHRSANGAAS